MSEVEVPKVGPVNKKVLIVVGGSAAVYVLWRYWQARQAGAEAPTDPGFGDAGVLPAVAGAGGAVSGIPAPPEAPQQGDFGFHGTTNDQWTQYAAAQLSASDVWSYTAIITALGLYLANQPLTGTQQQIVQAAIAVAGRPPQGTHVVVPGGDVPLLVAPSGVSAAADTDTQITVRWAAVAGAAAYQVFRTGAAGPVATVPGTSASITGLSASTAYTFQVAGATAAGAIGPKSGSVSATTKAKATTPPVVAKPFNPPKAAAKPKPPAIPAHTSYTVKRGDTLSGIAARHHKDWHAVWAFNLRYRSASAVKTLKSRGPDKLFAGETIWIPT